MTSRDERARQRAAWFARREAQLLDSLVMARGLIDELAQVGRWTPETARTIAGHLDDLARDAGLSDAYGLRVRS